MTVLAPVGPAGDIERPPWIPEQDWSHMSWHARRKAARRLRVATPEPEADAPKPRPRKRPARRRTPKFRVYREAPGTWVLFDGVQTARVHSAERAWGLMAVVLAVHPVDRGGTR